MPYERTVEITGTDVATGYQATVMASGTVIAASRQSRAVINIYNNGAVPFFLGPASTITAANGFPVPVGAMIEEREYTGDLWCIASAAVDARVWMIG